MPDIRQIKLSEAAQRLAKVAGDDRTGEERMKQETGEDGVVRGAKGFTYAWGQPHAALWDQVRDDEVGEAGAPGFLS